jgi:drug/metabolite transporter (DMT)-like permease
MYSRSSRRSSSCPCRSPCWPISSIGARLFGLERLGGRGVAAGLVAFGGLALMLGAQRGELAPLGLGFAFAAAACRTAMLLITRAALAGAEPRLTTFYSLVSSTIVLVAASLLTGTWALPKSALGWTGFLGTSVTTTLAILALFASAARIGPFRTALLMNLEPVVSTLLSLALLGEVMAPLQALGAAVMIGALVAFQKRA